MEISLIHVSYYRVTCTQFLELFLCLRFLKNKQPKITLMQRDILWGGKYALLQVSL